jgi:tocopherol O-methyltransferase
VAFLRAVLARPGVLRVLLDRQHDNRLFALTMLRIWLAYRLGAMKMMIICASKPEK